MVNATRDSSQAQVQVSLQTRVIDSLRQIWKAAVPLPKPMPAGKVRKECYKYTIHETAAAKHLTLPIERSEAFTQKLLTLLGAANPDLQAILNFQYREPDSEYIDGEDIYNFSHLVISNSQLNQINDEVIPVLHDLNNHKILRTLLTQRTARGLNIAHIAAMKGSVALLEWVYSKPALRSLLLQENHEGEDIVQIALQAGDLSTLKWIHSKPELQPMLRKATADGHYIAHQAAQYGYTDILDWVRKTEDLNDLLNAVTEDGLNLAQVAIAYNVDIHDVIQVLEWAYENLKALLIEAPKTRKFDICHCALDRNAEDFATEETLADPNFDPGQETIMILEWIKAKSDLVKGVLAREYMLKVADQGKKRKGVKQKTEHIYNHLFGALTGGNAVVARWFIESSIRHKPLRALWSSQAGKEGRVLSDLLHEVEATSARKKKQLPGNFAENVSFALTELRKNPRAFAEELEFEEERDFYQEKFSALSKQTIDIEQQYGVLSSGSMTEAGFLQQLEELNNSIQSQLSFLEKASFHSMAFTQRIFGQIKDTFRSVEVGVVGLQNELKRLQSEAKVSAQPVVVEGEAPEASVEVDLLEGEKIKQRKQNYLAYLSYLSGFTSDKVEYAASFTAALTKHPEIDYVDNMDLQTYFEALKVEFEAFDTKEHLSQGLRLVLNLDDVYNGLFSGKKRANQAKQNTRVSGHRQATQATQKISVDDQISDLTNRIAQLADLYRNDEYVQISDDLSALSLRVANQAQRQTDLLGTRSGQKKDLEGQRKQAQTALENAEAELTSINSRLDELREQLEWSPDEEEEIERLISQKPSLELTVSSKEDLVQDLNDKLAQLKRKLPGTKAAKERHAAEYPRRVEELKAMLARVQSDAAARPVQAPRKSTPEPVERSSQPLPKRAEALEGPLPTFGSLVTAYADVTRDAGPVKKILRQNPDLIAEHTGDGYTILFSAIEDEQIELVDHLLLQNNPAPAIEVEDDQSNTYNAIFTAWNKSFEDNWDPDVDHHGPVLANKIQHKLIQFCEETDQGEVILNAFVEMLIESYAESKYYELQLKESLENYELSIASYRAQNPASTLDYYETIHLDGQVDIISMLQTKLREAQVDGLQHELLSLLQSKIREELGSSIAPPHYKKEHYRMFNDPDTRGRVFDAVKDVTLELFPPDGSDYTDGIKILKTLVEVNLKATSRMLGVRGEAKYYLVQQADAIADRAST